MSRLKLLLFNVLHRYPHIVYEVHKRCKNEVHAYKSLT
jgi:hypothetical protein